MRCRGTACSDERASGPEKREVKVEGFDERDENQDRRDVIVQTAGDSDDDADGAYPVGGGVLRGSPERVGFIVVDGPKARQRYALRFGA